MGSSLSRQSRAEGLLLKVCQRYQLLGEVLEEAGFTPTCFGLGEPALAAMAEHHFDLMVIDIGLPDMNERDADLRKCV